MKVLYDSAKEKKDFQRVVSAATNSLQNLKRVEGKMFPQCDQDALDLAIQLTYEDWKESFIDPKKGGETE